jgi:hypoxanthine phosphoribosyltransferase
MNDMIMNLINRVKNDNITFDGVYGIPRGGLILATVISHYLHLPILMAPSNNSLVVDDISDTGETLMGIKHKKILTLFYTTWSISKPDYFYDYKLRKEDWIVFPWEDSNE